MNLTQLQSQAIDAIQEALQLGRTNIVVEMPAGLGKEVVLSKT